MQILPFVVFALPAALYLAAWRVADSKATALTLAGLAAHAASLYAATAAGGVWHFGFAPILSATLWIGIAVIWVEGLNVRVRALRSVVLPVGAVCAFLPLLFPGADQSARAGQPLFVPHLLVGTIAYGVLGLAALQAVVMAAAERSLHGVPGAERSVFARFLEDLPPLLTLERMLFRLIGAGFVFLTLTAASGVIFSEEVFGRPMTFDHKTVFALVAWGLFAVLLLGRRLWGWRGRTALRLTLGGFALLLLAYVGSRFVLEVVLGRT